MTAATFTLLTDDSTAAIRLAARTMRDAVRLPVRTSVPGGLPDAESRVGAGQRGEHYPPVAIGAPCRLRLMRLRVAEAADEMQII